ncbi:MAG: NAD-dependent deacylase [Polyangiaceae bacterium]
MSPLVIGTETRVFILTGAGISAESGIATFRDANGLWEKHRFEDVASPEGWAEDPTLVWRFYSERRAQAATCRPNAAHLALSTLEAELGDRLFLCTQNVDPLHERAGSKRVVHMHGELMKTRCEDPVCALPPFEDTALYMTAREHKECPACGARLRPHIVWFGEVPFELDRIADALARADLFVTIGSSGAVYPAAGFVARVRQLGRARTVYVGPERPDNASSFDEIRLGKAGDVVPSLFSVRAEPQS